MQHLALGSLEPSGTAVRGPGVVAADLVRGGLACRDMYAASRVALEALAEQAEALGHMSRRRPFLARWQPDAAVDWVRCVGSRSGPAAGGTPQAGCALAQSVPGWCPYCPNVVPHGCTCRLDKVLRRPEYCSVRS